jgi:GntR family transcriptional repressor for pyruvate dehydrogenase complex
MMSDHLAKGVPVSRPRKRESLVDHVVGKLRQLIQNHSFAPGTRLPSELELVAELKVSRTVLREAVRQLGAVGLIEVRHGQGMFVGDGTVVSGGVELVRSSLALAPRDLTQFLDLRAALECYAVRRAAERAGPEATAELEAFCRQMDQPGLPYGQTIELDFAFHRKLFEVAGNPLMLGVLGVLQELIVAGMLQTTPNPRDRSVSQDLHYAIVDAVRNHDVAGAEAAMREHMRITGERLAAAAKGDEMFVVSTGPGPEPRATTGNPALTEPIAT